ncbi:hypothetical protein BDW62DRAFT_88297 [Aspergillus aurantiobrunneus]
MAGYCTKGGLEGMLTSWPRVIMPKSPNESWRIESLSGWIFCDGLSDDVRTVVGVGQLLRRRHSSISLSPLSSRSFALSSSLHSPPSSSPFFSFYIYIYIISLLSVSSLYSP